MHLLTRLQIRYLLLAAGILLAGLFLSADPAQAHGSDGAGHADAAVQTSGDQHAKDGHPGHCHGGSFCGGVAVLAAIFPALQPDTRISLRGIPQQNLRAWSVIFYDPPPPRLLS